MIGDGGHRGLRDRPGRGVGQRRRVVHLHQFRPLVHALDDTPEGAGVRYRPMAETWEVLTLRGLSATDERAEEFTGTLVIHRVGTGEPVESVAVRVKRSVLVELHDTLGRLLARSVGFRPKKSK